MPKKKIAIVVQRYGPDVNGGAEVHARLIAEKLAATYAVDVLTSCAVDYTTWQPTFTPGLSVQGGVSVLRFPNEPRSTGREQWYWGKRQRGKRLVQLLHKWLGRPIWFSTLFPKAGIRPEDGQNWLRVQGPYMPELMVHLKENEVSYAAIIFVTALYYPSAVGVLTVPEKSILIPTMHDEKAIHGEIYQQVMASPRWLFFNTKAEQTFSEGFFNLRGVKKRIVGVGIEVDRDLLSPDASVPARYGITKPYLLYVGRIDKAKGCDELTAYFLRFCKKTGTDLQLVMVGKPVMKVDTHPNIILTGFVEEETKKQLMLQAKALVMPSVYESLSLVLLESFGCAVPVVANGHTDVLRDHINDSGGGWNYFTYNDFENAVTAVATQEEERVKKGESGYHYVKANYTWPKVLSVFDEAIADIERGT